MSTMIQTLQSIAKKQHTYGLLAVMWGAGLGCALSISFSVILSYMIFGTQTAVLIYTGITTTLTLIGSLVWLLMEWLVPTVKDARSFGKAFRNAAIAALLMPVLLVSLAIVFCTWRVFRKMYPFLWPLVKQTKLGENISETLHLHSPI